MKRLLFPKASTACAFTAFTLIMMVQLAAAETVTVSLSQEQSGGEKGRACIYVHQGKAEFRLVKSDESCEPQITIDTSKS